MTSMDALFWLLAFPLIASPVIYLIGRICVRSDASGQNCEAALPARWLALVTLLLTWIPFSIVTLAVIGQGSLQILIGGVAIRMDGVGLILAGTALLLGTLVVIFSMPYMAGEESEEKYYALLPMMIAAVVGLGCANDLFNMWLWFELMAVSSYLLVAFYVNERGALEAGLKYLVQSAVGSVLVLMGIAIVFSQAHTLKLDEITTTFVGGMGPANSFLLAAGALFIIGFGVKTAIVPLHTWLPDAHSQAPSGISAMLSGVVIEAGLIAMLRALGALPGGTALWGGLLLGFGALNMLVGNLMALRQTQIKRLLAYSSLSHVGYMLLGFGAAILYNAPNAAAGGFFHLFNHALMKGLAFLSAGIFLYTLHVAQGSHLPLVVDDLNGASKRYPLAAFGLSVAVLALGGLPPLAGFMSKWQIFAGAAETRSLPVILLVVFAALNSVLSLGYYAPLVNRLYRRQPSHVVLEGKRTPALMAIPVAVLVLLVVVIGFYPGLVQGFTNPATQTFMAMFGSQPFMVLR